MEKLKEAIKELGEAHEAFKTSQNQAIKDLKEKGFVPADLQEKIDNANEAVGKWDAEKTALENQIAEIKTAINRPGFGNPIEPGSDPASLLRKEATKLMIRKGWPALSADQKAGMIEHYKEKGMMTPDEQKALSVGSDPDGGYYVRNEMATEVVKKIFESSPVRQLAAIETISTAALDIIVDRDEAAQGWVGEVAARTETATPKIGKREIPVHEQFAEPRTTQKLLDDSSIDHEAWLTMKISEKFARAEATEFVNGNGTAKPRGFLTYPAGVSGSAEIEQVNSGSAGAVDEDGLLDLFYALKGEYRTNSTWMMQRLTVKEVRKLKDLDGQFIWRPGLEPGQPSLLLSRPLVEADDMPAVAADSLSIVLADFRRFYQIVDRIGIRVLRDPFTAKPFIKLYTTMRVGGDVLDFEAGKIQKLSA